MKIAVCLYVRNEGRYLLEWMIHHTLIGFDTLIVMDNLSEDDTYQVAQRYSESHDVRLETWSDTTARAQLNCYEHVLLRYGMEFEWIAFIDSDEFIMPLKHGSIRALLDSVGDHGALGINWAIYGTSGHVVSPEGLVTENFLFRAEDSFPPNQHIKSIVKPACTVGVAHPHLFHLRGEYIDDHGAYRSDYVDCSGQMISWGAFPGHTVGTPDLSICRINHYFTRAQADWTRKLTRKWRDIERGAESYEYHNRNEVRDEAALVFTEGVKARLRGWQSASWC